MGRNFKLLFICFALLVSTVAQASSEQTTGKVSYLQVYPDYGDGDIIFQLDIKGSTCKGYYISQNSPGGNAAYSLLLTAMQNNKPVLVYGLTGDVYRWSGSSTNFCKLYTVRFLNPSN